MNGDGNPLFWILGVAAELITLYSVCSSPCIALSPPVLLFFTA